MKRKFYIACFILLGVLLGFILHALVEMFVIGLLVSDWDKYGLGLTFEQWMWIHDIFLSALITLGVYFGYSQGQRWWRILYVLKKYGEPKF